METLGILITLIGGLWAWSKYIIERSLIPPAELSLDYNLLDAKSGSLIIEFLLLLKNIGNSTLVATDVKIRIKYLMKDDDVSVFTNRGEGAKFGRLNFPNSRSSDFSKDAKKFTIIGHDTFVQPGVNQVYSFITTIPEEASFVLLKGEFKYAQQPTVLQRIILWVSRQLGLINWSLSNIHKPHTVERCYKIERGKAGITSA